MSLVFLNGNVMVIHVVIYPFFREMLQDIIRECAQGLRDGSHRGFLPGKDINKKNMLKDS